MSDSPRYAAGQPATIRQLFSRIAPSYDFINRVLSLGLDRHWRRWSARQLQLQPGQRVLDLCGGTGDFLLAAGQVQPGISGYVVDFVPAMLHRAHTKLQRTERPPCCCCADVLQLPIADACVDVILVGFGLRNLADPRQGVAEMVRVLRPGGRLAILDFFHPSRKCQLHCTSLLCRRLLPLVGGLLSGDRLAYQYLPRSVAEFASVAQVSDWLTAAGLVGVASQPLTAGMVTLLLAQRPEH